MYNKWVARLDCTKFGGGEKLHKIKAIRTISELAPEQLGIKEAKEIADKNPTFFECGLDMDKLAPLFMKWVVSQNISRTSSVELMNLWNEFIREEIEPHYGVTIVPADGSDGMIIRRFCEFAV